MAKKPAKKKERTHYHEGGLEYVSSEKVTVSAKPSEGSPQEIFQTLIAEYDRRRNQRGDETPEERADLAIDDDIGGPEFYTLYEAAADYAEEIGDEGTLEEMLMEALLDYSKQQETEEGEGEGGSPPATPPSPSPAPSPAPDDTSSGDGQ